MNNELLNRIRDEVAKEKGYKSWAHCIEKNIVNDVNIEPFWPIVCERYAAEKEREAVRVSERLRMQDGASKCANLQMDLKHAHNRWISVKDHLPELETEVLLFRDYRKTFPNRKPRVLSGYLHHTEKPIEYGGPISLTGQGYLTGHYWSFPSICEFEWVTHWQPIPNPPGAAQE